MITYEEKEIINNAMSWLSDVPSINNNDVFFRAARIRKELINKLQEIDRDLSEHFRIVSCNALVSIEDNL